MARLSLLLLGQMVVKLDQQPVTGFESSKVRALLAYLAVESDRPHSREALACLLWPDQPEQAARNNLRQALANLRQAIGDQTADPPFLEITRETVQINQSSDHWTDSGAFMALLDANEKHPHRHPEACPACIKRLEQAAGLYRGDFLEHFYVGNSAPFEEWALLNREKLLYLALRLFSRLAAVRDRWGDYDQAFHYASRQLELDPWCEEAYRQAMRAQACQDNRNAALALYEACRRTLDSELGVEPTAETQALYEQIRSNPGPFTQIPAQTVPAHLPELGTPFVNRVKELEDLGGMIEDPSCRLVTLIGPGGIGKTRLAVRLAQQASRSFRDGVCYVPLDGLESAGFLISALASALRLTFTGSATPQTQLFDYLSSKDLLLVLDSFEHLLDGVPLLSDILQKAPGVVLLVTSRQRLALQSEWLFDLEGLGYPGETVDHDPLDYAAVALFVQRAHQAQRRFTLIPDEVSPVIQICRMVEGFPLGIELAAAALRSRPCRVIAEEMRTHALAVENGLRDLPLRHSSLWAAFEYSWWLLSEAEQRIFSRLSVFRGGFEVQAAAQVAEAVDQDLAALVDQSLLRANGAGHHSNRFQPTAARYDMNVLLRQYAHQKLSEQGEVDDRRSRHLAFYLARAEEAEPHLYVTEQGDWLERLEADHDNLRAALGWALESRNAAAAARLGGALARFWGLHGYLEEGRRWLEQALALFPSTASSIDPQIKAKALLGAGALAWRQGDLEPARALMEESLDLLRWSDDSRELSRALHSLATVVSTQGDDVRAAALLEECLALDREIGNLQGVAYDLGTLGDMAYLQGDYPQARAYYEESLALHRTREDKQSIAICLNNLGEIARYQGDDAQSAAYVEEALGFFRELGARQSLAIALVNLGDLKRKNAQYHQVGALYREALTLQCDLGAKGDMSTTLAAFAALALETGRFEQAARLFSAAEALRETAEISLSAGQAAERAEAVAAVRLRLGEAFFAAAWDQGRRMDLERAVSLALAEAGG